MKKYIIYGFMLAVTWIFITGSAKPGTFVQGAFLGFPVSFAFRRFYPGEIKLVTLEKTPYLIEYIAIFLEAVVISNLEVAHRLLRPSKEVKPEKIEYRSQLKSPTGLAILADSITLTPGTLVIDHDENENKLLIHCLNGKDTEQTKEDIRKWEKLLKKCFR